MKRISYFVAGLLVSAVLFSGGIAYAASGVLAEKSTQAVYVDGQRVELDAYTIDGSNYVKLRDIGAAVDFNVYWDGTVQIQRGMPYTGEAPAGAITKPELVLKPPSEGDYSAAANPEIFTGYYTREAYNAVYEVLAATRIGDFTKTATACFEDYHDQQKFENLLINLSNGVTISMRACGNGMYEIYSIEAYRTAVDMAAANLFLEASQLNTDGEKVILINEWICDHMVYNPKVVFKPEKLVEHSEPVEGNCFSYAYLMNYLCRRLDVPCILIFGESHCWNMIWADGAWSYTDVSYNDQVYNHAGILLSDTPPKQPGNQDGNRFLMELLVPNSTK